MKRNSMKSSPQRRGGFTLTEVLLVLAILGVIAAMVIPNLLGQQQNAYKRQTKVNIAAFEQIAKSYAIDHDGEWPGNVDALINPGPGSDGKPLAPYMEKAPKDGWNQPLHYEYPNSKGGGSDKPAIWSSGQNKQSEDGGNDDINNWQQ